MLRLVLLCFIGFLIYLGTFTRRGVLDWWRISQQNQAIEKKIVGTRETKEKIDSQILALRKDKREQERMVREVLGYVRDSETVIEFD